MAMDPNHIVRKGVIKPKTGTKTNRKGNMFKARMPKSAGGGMGGKKC